MSKVKVTLLSWTQDPLETVYSVWEASKSTDALRLPAEIKQHVPKAEVLGLFEAVVAQGIPVGEHIDFVFMLEGVSVSWREQAVRHRIGVKPSPERLGSDIVMVDRIPDLSESSWWSQSMRIQDMGTFATLGEYRLPQTVEQNPEARARFDETMRLIESAYNNMVDAGIPMEDARELIPLGAQHRISWKLNMGAIQHIISKRGCWILQLGVWGPVIEGMVNELATKIHPVFRNLVTPPCLKGDTFNGCVYKEECRRRLVGDDCLPPCPLHWHHHVLNGGQPTLIKSEIPMMAEMKQRAEQYKAFWGRDPYTGKRI